MLSAIIGMILAVALNTPPGPAMALVATAIYGLTVVFAPRRGLVAKAYYRFQRRRLTEREDIIKRIFRQHQKVGAADPENIRGQLSLSSRAFNRHLSQLRNFGLLDRQHLQLTDAGRLVALRLVRAHRLWETYLNQEVGLTPDQIHMEAERLEHLLPEEMLDRVDAELGFPGQDPHGSEIPRKLS